jgi:hypothetical protein
VSFRVAVVACAPALLPRHGGLSDPLADLRAACLDAVSWLLADRPGEVLVLCPDPTGGHEPAGTSRAQAVAEHLLASCGHRGGTQLVALSEADPLPDLDGRAVLALADGSARRGARAPGYLDERAFAFDAAVGSALRGGDLAALSDLDPRLGEELLAEGVPVLRRLAAWVRSAEPCWAGPTAVRSAELTYDGDPYGVQYWVARWRCGPPGTPAS